MRVATSWFTWLSSASRMLNPVRPPTPELAGTAGRAGSGPQTPPATAGSSTPTMRRPAVGVAGGGGDREQPAASWATRFRAAPTAISISGRVTGLRRTWVTPRAPAWVASLGSSADDNSTTAVARSSGRACIARTKARPSIWGMIRSVINRSKGCPSATAASIRVRAPDPLVATSTWARQRCAVSLRMSRLVALSSVISTRRPSGTGEALLEPAAEPLSATPAVTVKWKVLPWPGWLSTQIRPSIRCTS